MRDYQFRSAEAVKKLVHLECERQEDKQEKRLRGLMEAQEDLEKMFRERYSLPQKMAETL